MKDDQTLYMTLFRAMGNMIVTWWEAVGEFPGKKGSQLQRKMEFEYAIYPHKGNWEEAETYAQARRLNTPAMVYQVAGGTGGGLALEQELLRIDDRNLQVSAFKKSEERDSLILRVYNPTGKTIRTQVKLSVPGVEVCEVTECNLNEEGTGTKYTVHNNAWEAEVEPSEIKTYEIVCPKGTP